MIFFNHNFAIAITNSDKNNSYNYSERQRVHTLIRIIESVVGFYFHLVILISSFSNVVGLGISFVALQSGSSIYFSLSEIYTKEPKETQTQLLFVFLSVVNRIHKNGKTKIS